MTKPSKKFDLANLDTIAASNKGVEFELLHPVTKEPLGMFITVYGSDSDVFRQHNRDMTNDKLRRNAAMRRVGKDLPVATVEDSEREGTELLVACTVGFRNIEFNGPMEFSTANAFKLYTSIPWVRQQVDAAIVDTENFMRNLPKL